jgi:hypothetical protein
MKVNDRFSESGDENDEAHAEEPADNDDYGALTSDRFDDVPEAADLKVEESAELKGEVAEEIEDANGIEVEELELERDIYEATPLDDSPEGAEAAFEKEEEAVDDAGDDFHDALAAVEEIEVEEDEVEVEGYESEAEADEEYVAEEIGEEAEYEVVVPDVAGKLERTLGSLWLLMLVVLAGVVLRILWYWKQPALWLDEANVTSEVLGRSFGQLIERSEERRVGKECGLRCRSRWSPYH